MRFGRIGSSQEYLKRTVVWRNSSPYDQHQSIWIAADIQVATQEKDGDLLYLLAFEVKFDL